MINTAKIIWADDEIDLLKPHILFLEQKGYSVQACTNGADVLEQLKKNQYDIVFLDENMPGLTGLDTLEKIRTITSDLPIVLITKNEDESLMEDAIGSKVDDYLIKPVKPNQLLLTIKKLLDNKDLVSRKVTLSYQQEFRNLGIALTEKLNSEEWISLYKKIVHWEIELARIEDVSMKEVLSQQKVEANTQFFKFIEKNYLNWINNPISSPILSHQIMQKSVFPLLSPEKPVFFILIDNLRYDQWKTIHPLIAEYFRLEQENLFYSILPTATQYARNAMFAGLLPLEMEKKFPNQWQNDDDEGGKNLFEEFFLTENIKRNFRKEIKLSYHKILNQEHAKNLFNDLPNLYKNDLNAIVFNFVDMISHARTDLNMIKELTNDEAAYRSLTLSWFEHSPLLELIKKLSTKEVKVVITSDHGTIRVNRPTKVIGERSTITNLRYKQGRNLSFVAKDVFQVKDPHEAMLPKHNVSTSFLFAKEDFYFVYQNNYNQFVHYYKDTFQHGGISLEEMIVPLMVYEPK